MSDAISKENAKSYVLSIQGVMTKKAILCHVSHGLWQVEVYQYKGKNTEGLPNYKHQVTITATNERMARLKAKDALQGVISSPTQKRMKGF